MYVCMDVQNGEVEMRCIVHLIKYLFAWGPVTLLVLCNVALDGV